MDKPLDEALLRVREILNDGCDRCSWDDLEMLEKAGFMDVGIYDGSSFQDSLEIGEPIYTFTAAGVAKIDALIAEIDARGAGR